MPLPEPLRVLSVSPRGDRAIVAGRKNWFAIWHRDSGADPTIIHTEGFIFPGAEFSPDGSRFGTHIVSRNHQPSIYRICDSATGEILVRLKTSRHEDPTYGTFSPGTGRQLVTTSEKGAVVWDTATGNRIAALGAHGGGVWLARFSNDGRYLLSGGMDGTAILWDANEWKPIRILEHQPDRSISVGCFFPDSQLIAIANPGAVHVRDIETNELRLRIPIHGWVDAVTVSPDGNKMACCTGNMGTVSVFDAHTAELLFEFRVITDGLGDEELWTEFSPSSQRLLVWGFNRAYLFDIGARALMSSAIGYLREQGYETLAAELARDIGKTTD